MKLVELHLDVEVLLAAGVFIPSPALRAAGRARHAPPGRSPRNGIHGIALAHHGDGEIGNLILRTLDRDARCVNPSPSVRFLVGEGGVDESGCLERLLNRYPQRTLKKDADWLLP